jgi:hypothetical protein
MGMLGLLKRIKLRLPKRRKAERQMPILTWEAIDQDAERELIEQMKQDAEQELSELERVLRNSN